MRYPFLSSLEGVLEEAFSILAPEYVHDQAAEVLKDLEREIDHEYQTRYVLIDGETGQLETRRLFEEYQQALDEIQEKDLNKCTVALVLLEA